MRQMEAMTRVLYVDDEQISRDAMTDCLKEVLPDARIDVFDDGSYAWEAVNNNKYDILITDVSMCGMDGTELAKLTHELSPDTEIFFVTGDIERNLIKIGVQPERCIYKPFSANSLRKKIDMMGTLPEFEIKAVPTENKTVQDNKKREKKHGLFEKFISKKMGR